MKKKVFRYFFDFTDGQAAWLNSMADNGWRLVKCGQLSYEFESCEPGEYEYAVDFVAHKAYSTSKDYKDFLESVGYKTFYKNVNVGIFIGTVQWRPWGEGAGQITTAPGSLQKELIILEKKKDGKPFDLHTDLSDSLPFYATIRNAYWWASVGPLALMAMFIIYAALFTPYMIIGALLCAGLSSLWIKPAVKFSAKVRKLKSEAGTNEFETKSSKIKAVTIIIMLAFVVFLSFGLFKIINTGGMTFGSGSALLMRSNSGRDYWNASYKKLNGFRQKSVSLDEGVHTFTVEITSESGEISFSIKGKDGTEYYVGSNLPTSTFDVQIEAKDKVILRVDAKSHTGSYKITWK